MTPDPPANSLTKISVSRSYHRALRDPASWNCGQEGRCRSCGTPLRRIAGGGYACRTYVLKGCPMFPPKPRHVWINGRCIVCGMKADP